LGMTWKCTWSTSYTCKPVSALRYRSPMGMEGTNLVRDAAVILGGRSVSQVE
jgi:hypothetical protein